MKIGSYNIRTLTPRDWGYKSWLFRRKGVAKIIKDYDMDIVAVQEVRNNLHQWDLRLLLDNKYDYFGMGRNTKNGFFGEQSGILYKKDKFIAIKKGDFFFSETPDKVGKGWDAKYKKRCVWLCLVDVETLKSFYVFSVHFDCCSTIARFKSSQLLADKIREINSTNLPVFALGDFNISQTEPEAAFRNLNIELAKVGLRNSMYEWSVQKLINGDIGTMASFIDELPRIEKRIDFIFFPFKNSEAIEFETIIQKYKGHFPSDHLPLLLTINLL